VVVPVGSETSRGLELTADAKLADHLTVNANLAYTDAKYQRFSFVDGNGNLVNASGHQIPNSPKWLANLWASYTDVFGLPVDVGGGVRYVGKRAGNDANTLFLNAYTTLNAYVTYRVQPNIAVSLRVENLTDKAFAQSADVFYPTQVLLGRPRYFQADISAKF
jgi:iron complex outermembrane receptor protein